MDPTDWAIVDVREWVDDEVCSGDVREGTTVVGVVDGAL
jgi:hypothetical protein